MTATYEYQYIRSNDAKPHGFDYSFGTYVIRANVTTQKGDGWQHAWFLMDGGFDIEVWDDVAARSDREAEVLEAWQNMCRRVLGNRWENSMWTNAVLEFTPAGAMIGLAATIEVARVGTEIVHESGRRDHRW